MKFRPLVLSAAATLTGLLGIPARADNMVSISIAPTTGAVTLMPRWATGPSLSGFHFMAQDLSLGGGANQFYSVKGTPIPAGGDISAFTRYISTSGAATPHADIGSKLTPNSYSALTSADPDLGYGPVNFYLIHRKSTGDYLAVIKPRSGTASEVTDLKPMSGPGGPATFGASGYFGLTFAASNLGYGLNYFYYLRTDPVSGFTKFGTLEPALLGTGADKFDLGIGGHTALAFTGTDVGYGTDKMYYLRLDPVTGFTILGTLHPLTGRTADIANLGDVFSALTYVPGDAGFGTHQFYTTGPVNSTRQSVSFAAIADRAIGAGSFKVAPSASSTLPVTLTVVSGSVGAASISGPIGGVFIVTPTAPGLITLQATQAGRAAPVAYESNMLRQSFTATGAATLAITNQPTAQSIGTGGTATFSVAASGTTTVSYQWRKAGTNITGNASATTATLTLPNVQAIDAASYDVVVTNGSGSLVSNAVTLTVTGAAPVITNSPLTASGTIGTAFSFTITASGTPTSYTASALPSGLVLNATTGAITGTPTTAATTAVLLGATNGTGTGNATLTITVTAPTIPPVITSPPAGTISAATAGTPFSYTVVASGSPVSYSATPLPAGLNINATTGVISGTPTAIGSTIVTLGATNSAGTATTTFTIKVAPPVAAPIITHTPTGTTSAATAGTPFSYAVVASGSPTSYSATPLPAGLNINATTGVISGTPTTAGSATVTLAATNSAGTATTNFTINVAAAVVAPVITNPPAGSVSAATAGMPFTYTVIAPGSPVSYSATPLPAGLNINATTGVISGTPTAIGSTIVTLGATNSAGTATTTFTIKVAPAVAVPVITHTPAGTTSAATAGTPFSYTVVASGSPTSYNATSLPAGLNIDATTGVISGTPTTPGSNTVTLAATNSAGTATTTFTINVAAAVVAPVITSTPAGTTSAATAGTPFSYTVVASGSPVSYSATPLPAGLIINATTGAISGTPTTAGTTNVTITATNAAGTATTTLVVVVAPVPSSRIVNFSARATSGPGSQTLIMGFVVAGDGKNLLVRGIGPTLSSLGITNALADPMLTLSSSSGALASNDNWQTGIGGQDQSASIATTAARVGAFALPNGSRDSALLYTVNNGAHTTGLLRRDSPTGVALIELYDTDTVLGSRLVNVSARINVTPGEGTLIAGLVIAGNAPKKVLIRGVGPALAAFDVTGVLADPQIAIFSGASLIAGNDNWETGTSTSAQIIASSAQVGAFALPAGSKDAALLAVLQPGAYTVQVTGVGNTSGVALIEVYDAP